MPYADPLTEAELPAALREIPDWELDGTVIRRSTTTHDFAGAVALVDAVAAAAEAVNHHPDIHLTGYRRVSFELTTHAVKAVTRRDIDLAKQIDRLILGDR
ncbi:MAG: 4a-hydroxytetrahydrobiopterin dehydratase [Chloroflexi bacterium]|nr:4a-hydroxytetrahydrobiopterin dehydratase [Chloroflexota bacterium]